MRQFTSSALTSHGFSLIEMAVVLFIVALLLGGLLPTVSSQIEQQRTNETRKQLDEIQQALIGYAITYGRLPCPASDTSEGVEKFEATTPGNATNGLCFDFVNGYVPAATLGFTTGVDQQGKKGFAVDGWGNRIRYAVTDANTKAFTKTDGMKTIGISTLSPDLLICANASASGFSASSCGSNNALTSSPGVPIIIFSTGKNGAYGGTGLDEAANLDGGTSRTFVSHTPTPSSVANGEFDDLVVWISPNILINRMVSAGKLP
jgi:prepilin-type N-terminal cleavage/methylation domain-containing protein